MADDFQEEIAKPTQMKIIHYIIAKTFFKAGAAWEKGHSPSAQSAFYLHLNTNVIFILMFGERSPPQNSNIIQMRDALHEIPQNIKIPLKLEKRQESFQDNLDVLSD